MVRVIFLSGWKAAAAYTLWWARVLVQRFMCADQHEWSWDTFVCARCGLTGEELQDHSLRWRKPQYFVWTIR